MGEQRKGLERKKEWWRKRWRARMKEEEWEVQECGDHPMPGWQDFPGRLRERVGEWRKVGVSEKVLGWVEEGVRSVWMREPKRGEKENCVAEEDRGFVGRELGRMVRLGVLEERSVKPRVCHALVVARKEGKCVCKTRRLCVNGKEVNAAAGRERETMEGLKGVKFVVEQGDWMIKVDLQDYYLHFRLEKEEREWWGVRWGRKYFRFRAAIFGFRRSAEVASRVSKELMRILNRRGHRGLVWVDDFLFCYRTKEQAEAGAEEVVRFLEGLGFVVGQKSVLEPVQRIGFLGLEIDSVSMRIYVPQTKVDKLREELKEVAVSGRKGIVARRLAEVVGRLNSVDKGFVWGRVVRGIGRALSVRRPRWMWGKKVDVREEFKERLLWAAERLGENVGRGIVEGGGEKVVVWTDASGEWGWGVVVVRGGVISRSGGEWREGEREKHINDKELMAVERIFEEEVWKSLGLKENEEWVLKIDNTVALSYVKRGGGRIQRLAEIAERVWWNLARRRIVVVGMDWVRSEWNWADVESRREEVGGWRTRGWLRRWGEEVTRHSIGMDVFASAESAIVRRFYSKWDSPGSEGRNAFLREWEDGSWIVPELGDAGAAVLEVFQRKIHAMIVIPAWQRTWVEEVRRKAKWVVEWVEMEKGAVVYEPEGLRGLTEIGSLRNGRWLMGWVCPGTQETRWSGQQGCSMKVACGGSGGGVRAEELKHFLQHRTCWKSMCGGWSCRKDGVEACAM